MIYRRRLELEIIEAQPDLSMLHDAAVELCTSDKLRRLLQVCIFPQTSTLLLMAYF
jgi:hypothetical protein